MNIVLLQDEIYLPSFGGGTKANRCLLESFARNGHNCLALTRALTRSPEGPNDAAQFITALAAHGIVARSSQEDVYAYEHHGVQVEALDLATLDQRQDYLVRRIEAAEPDWVLVTDDKRRFMLKSARPPVPQRPFW